MKEKAQSRAEIRRQLLYNTQNKENIKTYHQKLLEAMAEESKEFSDDALKAILVENQTLKAQNAYLKNQMESQEIIFSITKVHEALKSRYFRMNELVCNPGLDHLALQILGFLDAKSLANCRVVSKSWKICIDSSRIWWLKRLHHIMEEIIDFCLNDFSEFLFVIDYFMKSSLDKLQRFVELLQDIYDQGGLRLGRLSPLHLAAEAGNLEFLNLMLETSIQFDLRDGFYNWTPLYFACQAGQTEVVKFFYQHSIDKSVDFKSRWTDERTPLHCACKNGHLETVEFLLQIAEEKGINVNAVDERLCTPFNYACASGNHQLVECLFQSKMDFDVNASDIDGRTALHKVCRSRCPEENQRKKGERLRLINVYQCVGNCTDTRLFELFIKYSDKVNFNALESNGYNALHIVCENGCLEKIRLLFQNVNKIGINVNAINDQGLTPLHTACVMDNEKHLANICDEDCPEVLETILKYSDSTGINLNATGEYGRTLLHLLCLIGCAPKVRKFIEYGLPRGLNVQAEDRYFQTPRQYTMKHRRWSIAQVLDDFNVQ